MKHTWKKTTQLRAIENALVDYVADGILFRDGENIPCEIGYSDFYSQRIEPTHIFIKAGVTASGHHYEDETIEL